MSLGLSNISQGSIDSLESVECLVDGWDHVILQKNAEINTMYELYEADTQRPSSNSQAALTQLKVQSQNKAYGLGNQDHVGLGLLAVFEYLPSFRLLLC